MKKKKILLIVWILILMSGGIFLENIRSREEETLEHLKLQQQNDLGSIEKEEEKKEIFPQKIVDILDLVEERTFFVQGEGKELIVVMRQCEMQSVLEFREEMEKKHYRCYLKEGQGKMKWEEISLIVKD